ncbi:MAG: hypothetical protein AMXMBFR64_44490 [Myxococcales bacterium]
MSVTQQDRDYMRRIGAYKALSHAEAAAAHAALSLTERLRESWALSLRASPLPAGEADCDAGDPDELRFYERARALGLCDP